MHYRYYKHSLTDEEKNRMRVVHAVNRRVAHSAITPSENQLVNDLVRFIQGQSKVKRSEHLLGWILNYGNARMIQSLVSLTTWRSRNVIRRSLRNIDSKHILPKEHVSPDIQVISSTNRPQSALICFTGNALQLNIPVRLFHFQAAKYFDLVIYLRDASRELFQDGINGFAVNQEQLIRHVHELIPTECPISVIGTSGGGYAAANFISAVRCRKAVLFSPPSTYKGKTVENPLKNIQSENLEIFFGRHSARDKPFHEGWKKHIGTSSLYWLDTTSHGTLKVLYNQRKLEQKLQWLAGIKPQKLGLLSKIKSLSSLIN